MAEGRRLPWADHVAVGGAPPFGDKVTGAGSEVMVGGLGGLSVFPSALSLLGLFHHTVECFRGMSDTVSEFLKLLSNWIVQGITP